MTAKRAYRTTFEALDALHAERDAALLPMIKAALERRHVTDPEVWDGYPCSAAEDDESDYYGGLFLNLERCARLDPSGVTSKAIRIAFEFGQASIVGTTDPEKVERVLANMEKQERRYKKGGTTTGPEAAADAKERNRVLKDVWRAYRGQFGDGLKLAKKVCAGECKYVDDSGNERNYTAVLSLERIKALFSEWTQEAVIAAERETWATSGWREIRRGKPATNGFPGTADKHSRSTHDGYFVLLFDEGDGVWSLSLRLPFVADKRRSDGTVVWGDDFERYRNARTESGVSLDDAKAGSYVFIEETRERELLAKREKQEYRRRMDARLARDSAGW